MIEIVNDCIQVLRDDGLIYVVHSCCELPSHISGDVWKNDERVHFTMYLFAESDDRLTQEESTILLQAVHEHGTHRAFYAMWQEILDHLLSWGLKLGFG